MSREERHLCNEHDQRLAETFGFVSLFPLKYSTSGISGHNQEQKGAKIRLILLPANGFYLSALLSTGSCPAFSRLCFLFELTISSNEQTVQIQILQRIMHFVPL